MWPFHKKASPASADTDLPLTLLTEWLAHLQEKGDTQSLKVLKIKELIQDLQGKNCQGMAANLRLSRFLKELGRLDYDQLAKVGISDKIYLQKLQDWLGSNKGPRMGRLL